MDLCVCMCMCVCLWGIRSGCSTASVCAHTLFFFVKKSLDIFKFLQTQKPTVSIEITCKSTHMHSVEVWWCDETITFRILSTWALHQRYCCFTNVLLMCIVSSSPSPIHSLSAGISVDWSRHKLITITHWSNWPGPDQRVATDWLVEGSILWSEEVGAEDRDAEEGGRMLCNVADQCGWTVQFPTLF